MRRFVLLGDPVGHSLSPAIHGAAFAAWQLDARYESRRVGSDEVELAMHEEAAGNVTLPHKLRAAKALDRPTDDVRATAACNCFWHTADGRLAGDNTDVGGLGAALDEASMEPGDARVLLLGAGGAARAAALALARGGARSIEVSNRTVWRARRLVTELDLGRLEIVEGEPRGPYDLVVNATVLGLDESDPLPLDLGRVETSAVFDLVYGAAGTEWTRRARALGIPAADGLGMLVHQAVLSLARWVPDRVAPIQAMREAAEAALAAGTLGTRGGIEP